MNKRSLCKFQMEWPYVMLVESLVFVLVVFRFVSLQNTFTGVSYYTYPVLTTAVLIVVLVCWALKA